MKKIIFFFLFSCIFNASAETSWAIKYGWNKTELGLSEEKAGRTNRYGIEVKKSIYKSLFMKTGFVFTKKESILKNKLIGLFDVISDRDIFLSLGYLELPIKTGLQFQITKKLSIYPYAGLCLQLQGKDNSDTRLNQIICQTNDECKEIKPDYYWNKDYIPGFDIIPGLSIGCGISVGKVLIETQYLIDTKGLESVGDIVFNAETFQTISLIIGYQVF